MKRNFIFAAVLFATLSIVNAIPHGLHKRATTFMNCPKDPSPPTASEITMTPDPAVGGQPTNFTIAGTPSVEIPAGAAIFVAFADQTGPIGTPGGADFCSMPGITCPVAAGTAFSAANLQATSPTPLPDSYFILAGIVPDQNSKSPIFCQVAVVGTPPAGGPPAGGAPPPPDGSAPPPPAGGAPPPA